MMIYLLYEHYTGWKYCSDTYHIAFDTKDITKDRAKTIYMRLTEQVENGLKMASIEFEKREEEKAHFFMPNVYLFIIKPYDIKIRILYYPGRVGFNDIYVKIKGEVQENFFNDVLKQNLEHSLFTISKKEGLKLRNY